MIVFSINNKTVGVYNNKDKFKKDSFFYILDYLVEYADFDSRTQASKSINKEDLKDFYNKDDHEIKVNDIIFTKFTFDEFNKLLDLKSLEYETVDENEIEDNSNEKIEEEEKEEREEKQDNNIEIKKGKFIKLSMYDLDKPIQLLKIITKTIL